MQAGMDRLRRKSVLLTSYLEFLLHTVIGHDRIEIFTPSDPEQRGCQLSISFLKGVESETVNKLLLASGVICDVRKPNVMRVAPAPLYNSFGDVYTFIQILKKSLDTV
jgi:kynureninase